MANIYIIIYSEVDFLRFVWQKMYYTLVVQLLRINLTVGVRKAIAIYASLICLPPKYCFTKLEFTTARRRTDLQFKFTSVQHCRNASTITLLLWMLWWITVVKWPNIYILLCVHQDNKLTVTYLPTLESQSPTEKFKWS